MIHLMDLKPTLDTMILSTCENVTSILKTSRGEISLQRPCLQSSSKSLFLWGVGGSHLESNLAPPLSPCLTSLKDADWSGHILSALELFKMDRLEFSLEISPVELDVNLL